MKHFETELPEGYREVFTVDAADQKTGIKLNLMGLPVLAVTVAAAWLILRPRESGAHTPAVSSVLLFIGGLLAYLVLHELTHGAAYKLLTRRKLTFGIAPTVAYCGVPDIYIYRRAALISLLAPFCVFTVVFGVLTAILQAPWDKFLAAVALGIHIGSCSGDLYDTFLYLFRFRDPRTLMRDTGPKQTFYVPKSR